MIIKMSSASSTGKEEEGKSLGLSRVMQIMRKKETIGHERPGQIEITFCLNRRDCDVCA